MSFHVQTLMTLKAGWCPLGVGGMTPGSEIPTFLGLHEQVR